jgi:hypothetical protein
MIKNYDLKDELTRYNLIREYYEKYPFMLSEKNKEFLNKIVLDVAELIDDGEDDSFNELAENLGVI